MVCDIHTCLWPLVLYNTVCLFSFRLRRKLTHSTKSFSSLSKNWWTLKMRRDDWRKSLHRLDTTTQILPALLVKIVFHSHKNYEIAHIRIWELHTEQQIVNKSHILYFILFKVITLFLDSSSSYSVHSLNQPNEVQFKKKKKKNTT